MSFEELLFTLFSITFALSIIDRIIGNRVGIGSKVEEGFHIMGRAIFSMSGILYLYPILSGFLIQPSDVIANTIKSDSAVFISCFLPIDMGGYHIAKNISNNETAKIIGILLSSTLGATIGFTYPAAFGMLKKEDFIIFVKGSIIGIISIPIGILFTSIIFGFKVLEVLKLISFVILFTILLIIGIIYINELILKLMKLLGNIMSIINLIGLLFLGIKLLTGKYLLFKNNGLAECIKLPLKMAVLIGGSYTFFYIIYSVVIKLLGQSKRFYGIDSKGFEGMLILLTNCVPTLFLFDKMDYKSKIINAALCINLASVVGPQLAFLGSVEPPLISIFMINKFISGVISFIIILRFYERL